MASKVTFFEALVMSPLAVLVMVPVPAFSAMSSVACTLAERDMPTGAVRLTVPVLVRVPPGPVSTLPIVLWTVIVVPLLAPPIVTVSFAEMVSPAEASIPRDDSVLKVLAAAVSCTTAPFRAEPLRSTLLARMVTSCPVASKLFEAARPTVPPRLVIDASPSSTVTSPLKFTSLCTSIVMPLAKVHVAPVGPSRLMASMVRAPRAAVDA